MNDMPNQRGWPGRSPYDGRQSPMADMADFGQRLRAGFTGGACLLICIAFCAVGGMGALIAGIVHASSYSALVNLAVPSGSLKGVTPPATATPVPSPNSFGVSAILRTALTCDEAVNNSHARICVHTKPGATLQITIRYCSGQIDPSPSLQGIHNADRNGDYEWDWVPQSTCTGSASARIIARLSGFSPSDLTYPFTLQPGAGGTPGPTPSPSGAPSPQPTVAPTASPTTGPGGGKPTPTPTPVPPIPPTPIPTP